MISAQTDTVMQEQLIEKYMLLPNQVWDDIISQASKVRISREKKMYFICIVQTFCLYRNLYLKTIYFLLRT